MKGIYLRLKLKAMNWLVKDLMFYPEKNKLIQFTTKGIFIGGEQIPKEMENKLKAEVEQFNNSFLKTILMYKPKYSVMENMFISNEDAINDVSIFKGSKKEQAFNKGILWAVRMQESIINDLLPADQREVKFSQYNPYDI